MPFKQFVCFEDVIKQLVHFGRNFVRTLVLNGVFKILSVTVEVIEATLVEVLRPARN